MPQSAVVVKGTRRTNKRNNHEKKKEKERKESRTDAADKKKIKRRHPVFLPHIYICCNDNKKRLVREDRLHPPLLCALRRARSNEHGRPRSRPSFLTPRPHRGSRHRRPGGGDRPREPQEHPDLERSCRCSRRSGVGHGVDG